MIGCGEITPVGEFGKPHGIKGEIAVSFDPGINIPAIRYVIADIDGLYVPFFVESCRERGNGNVLFTIDGITDEKQAKMLARKQVFLRSDDPAIETGTDSYSDGLYASDLIGYTIVSPDGDTIGKIIDIDDSTENVLFIVERPDATDVLIPVADEFITDIDTDNAILTMDLPEGLF